MRTFGIAVVAVTLGMTAGCGGGTSESPSPSPSPVPDGPTVSQQSAALAAPVIDIYVAINQFAYDHDGALPVFITGDDEVHINGERYWLHDLALDLVVYGEFENYCVQASAPGVGVAEGGTIYSTMYGTYGAAEQSEEPCAASYTAAGPLEFPTELQPGYYRPLELPLQTSLCFNIVQYAFGGSATKEEAWKIIPCKSKHDYEIYGLGFVEDEWYDKSEDDQWDDIFAYCDKYFDKYRPKRNKTFWTDHVWEPSYADQPEPYYVCVGTYKTPKK